MATYRYTCPSCGNSVELRKRVTVTKRHCSYCNTPITTDEIDQQEEEAYQHAMRMQARYERESAEARRRTLMFQLIGGSVVVIFIAVVMLASKNSSRDAARVDEPKKTERLAGDISNSKRLNDPIPESKPPSSAEIIDVKSKPIERQQNEKNTDSGTQPKKTERAPEAKAGKTEPSKKTPLSREEALIGKWATKWKANEHDYAMELTLSKGGNGSSSKSRNGNPISLQEFKWRLVGEILLLEMGKNASEFKLAIVEDEKMELLVVRGASISPGQLLIFRRLN